MTLSIPEPTARETGGKLAVMSEHDVPDEVPVADAVEQAAPAADLESVDPDERVSIDAALDDEPPLETSAPDWQEQRQVVEGDPDDDFR